MKHHLVRLIVPFGLAAFLVGSLTAVPALAARLRIDTASEGYPCRNGVCRFPPGHPSWSYSAPITSTGGSGPTPYTWSVVAGALPDGLSLTPNYGVYSAYVYGTPTTPQTAAFTLQVEDGAGDTARQAFTLTIKSPVPPVISFPRRCCPDGTVGASYLQNFFIREGTGVAPYAWSIAEGHLPPGLSLSASPPASISGTPTMAGTFRFIVRVTDGTGAYGQRKGTITVQ